MLIQLKITRGLLIILTTNLLLVNKTSLNINENRFSLQIALIFILCLFNGYLYLKNESQK
jgi:hypothetical protein